MDSIARYFDRVDWQDIILSGLRIALILIVVWVALSAVRALLRRLETALIEKSKAQGDLPTEATKRAETLVKLLRQGIIILIWLMGLLLILRQLGIDVGPILASAGVVGLAVGFGAQNLVRDVISGFFMILENQIRVGDVAVINGTGGVVEQINFRTIVLRDSAGTVFVFPNGSITTLANMTRDWSAYVFNIGVAYKEDIDHVIDVMKKLGQELKEDPQFGVSMQGDIEVFGIDKFNDSAIVIQGRLKTLPIKQWDVGREYMRRLKIKFDAEGIEMPFPHRTIYFAEQNKPVLTKLAGPETNGIESTSAK